MVLGLKFRATWSGKGAALALVVALAGTAKCCNADFSARAVVRFLKGPHAKRSWPPLVCRIYVRGRTRGRSISAAIRAVPTRVNLSQDSVTVHIDLWSKGIAWILHPDSKTYDVRKLSGDRRTLITPHGKPLRQETVNGYRCDVYRDERVLGRERVTTTYWWFPPLNFPIRAVTQSSSGTTTVEARDIRVGPVSQSLFELPKGYKRRVSHGTGGTRCRSR